MPKSITSTPTPDRVQVGRVRRLAQRQGYKLVKVPVHSRLWNEYGPFSLLDNDTKGIVLGGVWLDQVAKWLTEDAARPSVA